MNKNIFRDFEPGTHKLTINLTNLPAGIYFYRIEIVSEGMTAQKVGKLIIRQ